MGSALAIESGLAVVLVSLNQGYFTQQSAVKITLKLEEIVSFLLL